VARPAEIQNDRQVGELAQYVVEDVQAGLDCVAKLDDQELAALKSALAKVNVDCAFG
jgi:hypothetical protein